MSNETIARCYKRVRRIKRSVKVKIPVLWSIGLQWRSFVRGVLAVAAAHVAALRLPGLSGTPVAGIFNAAFLD